MHSQYFLAWQIGTSNYLHTLRALTMATLLAQEKLLETEVEGFPPVGQVMGDFQAPAFDKTSERKYDQREAFRWARTVDATSFEDVREVRVSIFCADRRTEEKVEVNELCVPGAKDFIVKPATH